MLFIIGSCELENAIGLARSNGVEIAWSQEENLASHTIRPATVAWVKSSEKVSSILWSLSVGFRDVLADCFIGDIASATSDFIENRLDAYVSSVLAVLNRARAEISEPIILMGPMPVVEDPLGSDGFLFRISPRELALKLSLNLREALRDSPNLQVTYKDWEEVFIETLVKESFRWWHPQQLEISRQASFFQKVSNFYSESPSRKWIAVDLDNTLWKGVVSEVGVEGLKLEHHRLEALCSLIQRGFLVVVLSKNDSSLESVVRDWLKSQWPRQQTRFFDKSVVLWSLGWSSKAQRLSEISEHLKLYLKHCIFIDDSPRERFEVSESLPEVQVLSEVEFSESFKKGDKSLELVDFGRYTQEGLRRSELYRTDTERSTFREQAGAEYTQAFEVSVDVERVDAQSRARALELLHRTNRQKSVDKSCVNAGISSATLAKDSFVCAARDSFGDFGIVGVAVVRESRLLYFAVSCRVVGLGVEGLFLSEVLLLLGGLEKLAHTPVQTDSNSRFIESLKHLPVLACGDL